MKEQFSKEEIESVETEDIIELSMEERDKKAALFYQTATVYLNDYKNAEKIALFGVFIATIILWYLFSKFIMLAMFAILLFIICLFMFKDKLMQTVFNIISKYNNYYRENNLLLRRMTSITAEQTYQSISFNSRTKEVSKGVERRYWEALLKEKIGTERYNIYMGNILDNIDTIQDLSELKSLKGKEVNANE